MLVQEFAILIEQEGAAALGQVGAVGDVGAPVADRFGHVAEAEGGQLKGTLETTAASSVEGFALDCGEGRGLYGFVGGDQLGGGAIAEVAPKDFLEGARALDPSAHEKQANPGVLSWVESGEVWGQARVEVELFVEFCCGV